MIIMHSIKSAASLWLLRATKRPPFEKVLLLLLADTGTAQWASRRGFCGRGWILVKGKWLYTIKKKSKFLYIKMMWEGQKYRIHVTWVLLMALNMRKKLKNAQFSPLKQFKTLKWHECGISDLLTSFFHIRTYFLGLWYIVEFMSYKSIL